VQDKINDQNEQLHAQETIGHYGGHGGLGAIHSLYTPTSGGLSSGSYDDLHKYGGIGKKSHLTSLYDQGSKGRLYR